MIPREMMALIARRKLVAEVRVDTATQALSVVEALAAGGIGAFEIALTIPGASEILTHFATRGDIIVGAGAALEAQQALDAISSGARFIASPICAPDVAQACLEKGVACVLGALTPTEIIAAQRAGAEMVKLFPVEAIGGPAYVRSLLRQLTHISVQISGGFSVEHLIEYAELPIRSIALGALLAPPTLVERAAWQAITNRAQAFSQFASNPHVFAAQFLAMVAPPRPQPRPAANLPTMPVAPGAMPGGAMPGGAMPGGAMPGGAMPGGAMPGGAMPGGATPGGKLDDAPGLVRPPAAWQESSAASGSGSGSGSDSFRPIDSRPLRLGDDEDWLR